MFFIIRMPRRRTVRRNKRTVRRSKRTVRRNKRTVRRDRKTARRFPPYGSRRRKQNGGAAQQGPINHRNGALVEAINAALVEANNAEEPSLEELIVEVNIQLGQHPEQRETVKQWMYEQVYDGTWSINTEESIDLDVHPNIKSAVWALYQYIANQDEDQIEDALEALSEAGLIEN